jgi:hypothetical protein
LAARIAKARSGSAARGLGWRRGRIPGPEPGIGRGDSPISDLLDKHLDADADVAEKRGFAAIQSIRLVLQGATNRQQPIGRRTETAKVRSRERNAAGFALERTRLAFDGAGLALNTTDRPERRRHVEIIVNHGIVLLLAACPEHGSRSATGTRVRLGEPQALSRDRRPCSLIHTGKAITCERRIRLCCRDRSTFWKTNTALSSCFTYPVHRVEYVKIFCCTPSQPITQARHLNKAGCIGLYIQSVCE